MTDSSTVIDSGSVEELVSRLVLLVAPQKNEDSRPEQRLISDLGYHSLALAELAFTLEDLFGLDPLPPEKAMSLESVGDVTGLIAAELDGGAGHLPNDDDIQLIFARYGVEWAPQAA